MEKKHLIKTEKWEPLEWLNGNARAGGETHSFTGDVQVLPGHLPLAARCERPDLLDDARRLLQHLTEDLNVQFLPLLYFFVRVLALLRVADALDHCEDANLRCVTASVGAESSAEHARDLLNADKLAYGCLLRENIEGVVAHDGL